MSARAEQRKGTFKKATDADEARRKRQENTVDIRKGKKDESLSKRRREGMVQAEAPVVEDSVHNTELNYFVALVAGADPVKILEGVTGIRKKLSIERNPPINEVLDTGVVPKLIQLLDCGDAKIQFEAAWAITNIASGDSIQTRKVVEYGCVPPFVRLLSSPNDEVREQAIWAIGNIAGDGFHLRDLLLQNNVLQYLLPCILPTAKLSLIRNGTWALSNLCRGKPAPNFELVKAALPLLAQLLSSSDEDILTDACWAVSYLSDGTNDRIQQVIESGIAQLLVNNLSHPSAQVHTPALRALGNIVTGDESQTQAVLNCNPLPRLAPLLNSSRKGIRKEACWAISNITAGSKAQIQSVLDAGLVPSLVALLATGDFDVKREACWALSNATTGGSPAQIAFLVKHKCIKPLCDVLVSSDSKIVLVALEAIENILKVGADIAAKGRPGDENKYVTEVEEADGVDKIEELQKHSNEEIYKKVVDILEAFFNAEETENENANVNQSTFSFGVTHQVQPTFSF